MAGDRPLLSVCIPTFNRADMLAACLRSVMPQCAALAPGLVELVVSNNGSPDHTSSLRPEVPFVRWVDHSQNRGLRWNVDFVSREARGEFLMWLSDDDEMLPGALSRLVALVEALPEDVGYVWSPLPTYDHETGQLLSVIGSGTAPFMTEPGLATALRYCKNGWALTRQIYRRRFFNEHLSEKLEANGYFCIGLACDAMMHHRGYYTPEHFVRHRYGNEVYWDEWGTDRKLRRVRLDADCIEAVPETLEAGASTGLLVSAARWAWVAREAYLAERRTLRPERPSESAWYLGRLVTTVASRHDGPTAAGRAAVILGAAPLAVLSNAPGALRAAARRLFARG